MRNFKEVDECYFDIETLVDELLEQVNDLSFDEEITVYGQYKYIIELIEVLVRNETLIHNINISSSYDGTYMLSLNLDGISVLPCNDYVIGHTYSKLAYVHEDTPAKIADDIEADKTIIYSIAIYDDEDILEEIEDILDGCDGYDEDDDECCFSNCKYCERCEKEPDVKTKESNTTYTLNGKAVSKEEFEKAELESLKKLTRRLVSMRTF